MGITITEPPFKPESYSPCPHCGGDIGNEIAGVVDLHTASLESKLSSRDNELAALKEQFSGLQEIASGYSSRLDAVQKVIVEAMYGQVPIESASKVFKRIMEAAGVTDPLPDDTELHGFVTAHVHCFGDDGRCACGLGLCNCGAKTGERHSDGCNALSPLVVERQEPK